MIFRKAELKDAAELNHLLTLLIRDEKQYDDSIDEKFTVTNMYENYIEDKTKFIYLAEDNNKIIGYLYGSFKDTSVSLKRKAYLDALYIKEDYRGLGIANNLIKEFKNWVIKNKAKIIEVNVMYENKIAKELYRKHNFNIIRETLECNIDKE